jgi:hypothetical protein
MSSSSEKERQRNPFLIPDVGRIDPRGIGSVYGIPQKKEPDYIPFNSRGRDFLPRLCFNSGMLWLGGFTAGSLYGAREGYIGVYCLDLFCYCCNNIHLIMYIYSYDF